MAFSVAAIFFAPLPAVLWMLYHVARGSLPLSFPLGRALGGAALYFCFAAFDGLLGKTLAVNGIAALYSIVLGPAGALLSAALQLMRT